MHLNSLIEVTKSYRRGLTEAGDDSDYINAMRATFLARDMLLAAGFVQVGRSNQSEAFYLTRPGSTWLRIRCAARESVRSTEGVVTDLVFTNRYTADAKEWGEIDGERILRDTYKVEHTGLDQDDIDELVRKSVKKYDAVLASEKKRTKPLAVIGNPD